jgi:hypothetical protein
MRLEYYAKDAKFAERVVQMAAYHDIVIDAIELSDEAVNRFGVNGFLSSHDQLSDKTITELREIFNAAEIVSTPEDLPFQAPLSDVRLVASSAMPLAPVPVPEFEVLASTVTPEGDSIDENPKKPA